MSNPLLYEPKSAWEVYSRTDQKQKMQKLAANYLEFISQCKTERETITHVEKLLHEAGFSEDFNKDKIMRQLHGKTLFCACRGTEPLNNGVNLVGAHGDSPRLDLKQRPIMEQAGVAQARTHYYGGIRKYQWLARPLALHGVIITSTGKVKISIGEKDDEPVFCVADLLPHLAQKQAGQKLSEAFEGEKLNIVIGHEPVITKDDKEIKEPVKEAILNFLHSKYQIDEEDFITAELEAVPAGRARYTGFDQAIVGGYGQDDRICVFCALDALLNAGITGKTKVLMIWDKEEIGSDGASGAQSRFFEYCIDEMRLAWEKETRFATIMLNTCAISADVSAALDPDYPDVHEKQNAALFGYGPCFSKFTGSRGKYEANDADAEYYAALRHIFNQANIPWQAAELGKVDLGGGGTVAKYLASYGMSIIDLGPALLSMHSPFELASVADILATREAYRVFFDWSGKK